MSQTNEKEPGRTIPAWVTCEHALSLLVDYLDGSLPPEEKTALDRHLKGCPPCIHFVRKYRTTPHMCKKALETEMPDEMAERLTSFLRAKLKEE